MMDASILLVDDNEEFIDSIKDILEDEGYHIQTSTSGEEAIKISNKRSFDLVLMDIKMPGMNGVECFLKMKQRNPDVRVIMFTAYALTDLIQQAKDEGVCDVLKKPLNMDDLVKTIEKIKISHTEGLILVVDDDRDFCDNLCEALFESGYQVAAACDGEIAVDAVSAKKYDIVLLDMKMPKLNGLEVYRRIKKIQPGIITVLMTGYAEEMRELVARGLQENAHAYLTKPLDMKKLLSLMKNVLVSRKKTKT